MLNRLKFVLSVFTFRNCAYAVALFSLCASVAALTLRSEGAPSENKRPLVEVQQPMATTYVHSAVLTPNYTINGLDPMTTAITSAVDGEKTLPGNVTLETGQPINLLTALPLGNHNFSVMVKDEANNPHMTVISFSVIATPASIIDDVGQFFEKGAIKNFTLENSLLAKLNKALEGRNSHRCSHAAGTYQEFIRELDAQSGLGVDADAAKIMRADAEYLIAHCQ